MAGGEPADLPGDRVAERRQGRLHGRRQRCAEAGGGGTDPHERALGQPAPQDRREPDDLLDRELVRGPRSGVLPSADEPLEREHDDGARLDSDGRIDEEAGRARRDVEKGIDVEPGRVPDLAPGEDLSGKSVQRERSGRVVAPLGLTAHDQPDRPAADHRASSTVRSRKWVAHEMHGS